MSGDKALFSIGIVLLFGGLALVGVAMANSQNPIHTISGRPHNTEPHGAAMVIMGIVIALIGAIIMIHIVTTPPSTG